MSLFTRKKKEETNSWVCPTYQRLETRQLGVIKRLLFRPGTTRVALTNHLDELEWIDNSLRFKGAIREAREQFKTLDFNGMLSTAQTPDGVLDHIETGNFLGQFQPGVACVALSSFEEIRPGATKKAEPVSHTKLVFECVLICQDGLFSFFKVIHDGPTHGTRTGS